MSASRVEVLAPRIDVNDPEYTVVEVCVELGQEVEPGDVLCVLQSLKAAVDVEAEDAGFVVELRVEVNAMVEPGAVLLVLAAEPPSQEELSQSQDQPRLQGQGAAGPGLNITKPAEKMRQELGVDLALLPQDRLVTTDMVRQAAQAGQAAARETEGGITAPRSRAMAVVLVGGGGRGKKALDILVRNPQYEIAGIVDDGLAKDSSVMGVPVLGTRDELPRLFENGVRLAVNGLGDIGRIGPRVDIFELLQRIGFLLPTLVHASAAVDPSAVIGMGGFIGAQSFVEAQAELGFGVTVNSGAVVSHDCVIGDYTHLAPGATLAGNVRVGHKALLGAGVTTNVKIRIGDGARIGNAACLLADVPARTVIRAGTVWEGAR